ncbi:MAG: hypothetical protein ACR2OX_13175 [Methyloligellaceae bacterium]
MISAIQSALSGLQTASSRLEEAATTIVKSGARSASAFGVPSDDARQQNGPASAENNLTSSNFATLIGNESSSLVDGFVALKEAEISYKASAKLLGALLRTEGELLDIET